MKRILPISLCLVILITIWACTEEFIGPLLNADFTQTRLLIAKGDTITFGDKSVGKPDSYEWIFDGGNPATSTDRKVLVAFEDTGAFDVILIVKREGEIDTLRREQLIKVFPSSLQADFSADSTDIPVGTRVNFYDESIGDVQTRLWSFPAGSPVSSTDKSPSVFYSTPGSYSVTLSVNGFVGFDSIRRKNFINVYGPITADFESSQTIAEKGQLVSFSDLSKGSPNRWVWAMARVGGGLVSSEEQNPTLSFDTPGIWNVSLFAANPIFEESEQKLNYLTIHEPLTAAFQGRKAIPINEKAAFTDDSEGFPTPTSWNWTFQNANPGGSNQRSATPLWSQSGTYQVSLTVENGITSSTINDEIQVYVPLQSDLLMQGKLISTYDLPASFSVAFRRELGFKMVVTGSPEPIRYVWTLTHQNTGQTTTVETLDENLLVSYQDKEETDILLLNLGTYSLSVEAQTDILENSSRQVCSPCFEFN
ncbi:MAG: PKD domain-containing protein [Bacteroidota bacterium]